MNRRHQLQTGLSIVEMIVTIAVFVIVVGVLISSLLFFYRANAFNVEQAFAVSSARKGVEQMVRDIREVTYADDGAYPIVSIGSTTLTMYSDIDRDDNVERVHLWLEETTFRKGVTQAIGTPLAYPMDDDSVSTLSDFVRNDEEGAPIFEYFDSSGLPITDYANIVDVAFVRVNLIVNINPTRLPNEFTLRSSATLRNLKP